MLQIRSGNLGGAARFVFVLAFYISSFFCEGFTCSLLRRYLFSDKRGCDMIFLILFYSLYLLIYLLNNSVYLFSC